MGCAVYWVRTASNDLGSVIDYVYLDRIEEPGSARFAGVDIVFEDWGEVLKWVGR